MHLALQLAGIALIMVAAGHVIRPERGRDGVWLIAKVMGSLALTAVECIVTFVLFLVGTGALVYQITALAPSVDESAIYTSFSVSTEHLMVPVLIVLCMTGISAAWAHRKLARRIPWLRRSAAHSQLEEYFIQWSTIYLSVYQLVFNELTHAADKVHEIDGIKVVFDGVLNPDNLNLTMLPLLFSVWVAIVMGNMAAKHDAARAAAAH